jgi:hypothetical protein
MEKKYVKNGRLPVNLQFSLKKLQRGNYKLYKKDSIMEKELFESVKSQIFAEEIYTTKPNYDAPALYIRFGGKLVERQRKVMIFTKHAIPISWMLRKLENIYESEIQETIKIDYFYMMGKEIERLLKNDLPLQAILVGISNFAGLWFGIDYGEGEDFDFSKEFDD